MARSRGRRGGGGGGVGARGGKGEEGGEAPRGIELDEGLFVWFCGVGGLSETETLERVPLRGCSLAAS